MSLRLFMDQCVPRSVTESLRNAGHAVDLLRSHLPINAKDPDVIARAQNLEAVLVTLNGDFANMINYPPAKFGGIIALQVKNHPESRLAVITLQRPDPRPLTTTAWSLVLAETILGPIQAALLILAVRRRFMR